MRSTATTHKKMLALAALTAAAALPAMVQAQDAPDDRVVVTGTPPVDPASMTKGPELKGFISARSGDRMQVTEPGGKTSVVTITDATEIKATGGFLGLNKNRLPATQLLNGTPVTVKTLQGGGTLVASRIDMANKDLRTASMIRNGTDQRFAEQTAATEALKGRMGDIDQYNVKGTTNVNFDTGKAALSPQAKAELCNAARDAEATENALLLVVGYTDSTGPEEFNQTLSEKRAASVVNYLQQACKWKPYRMLTPTGMAEADPTADNSTEEGKAQNRRVAVNILVSKAVEGL
ncbi:OmpA family protein [Sphingomonas turrisvirgatae]|uniref:Cell envelope biogenesis protein OmpA n=1 Tax=Sphingomonas turrisvirgatae TaxID=1888892 RepID=A0A1E3LR03_9SPHN|nr:OmpA family protein [Sphingomonas turrisvirgatae]ODP36143.1 cell envelope biogenesis protein OmpA [Sphingomonas turrisvirgatae]